MRRISTLSFARLAAAQLDNGQKLAEVIERPMMREIAETMDAHERSTFFFCGPVQAGKTAILQLHLLRNLWVRGGPALWYGPTAKFIKEFSRVKWGPLFDANAEIAALLFAGDRSKNAAETKILAGGRSVLMLSGETENDRTGKTGRDIYRDEAHLWEAGWMAQTSNRHADYPDDFTEYDSTTGLIAGTDAAIAWERSDQRTWHCRCPKCHEYFEPRYAHRDAKGEICGGVRYTKKFLPSGLPDENALAASLYYECPHCHEHYLDTAGSRLLFSGTSANPVGRYVRMNPAAAPSAFGWTFNAIAIRPWLPIVVRFELAQLAKQRGDYEKLAECIREEFAGVWNPMKEMGEKKKRPIGDYAMGAEWPGESKDPQGRPWRFCCVDVQLDHFVLVIRAWGPFSCSRLIWVQKVTTPGHIADLCALHRVPPERTILDGRHSTDRVRRICGQMGWRTFLGEGTVKDYAHLAMGGIRRIYSEPKPIDPWTGTTNQGQGLIFEFNFSKTSALDRLHNLRTLEANDGSPLWTAAKDAPDWYFREVDAFYRMPKKNEAGQMSYLWAVNGPDHASDCECMNVVGASMAGLVGSEALETSVETTVEPAKPGA